MTVSFYDQDNHLVGVTDRATDGGTLRMQGVTLCANGLTSWHPEAWSVSLRAE